MSFIHLRSYDTYIPASLNLQRLEEEGIRAYLKDEFTVTADPILTNAIGGIKLMVYKDQAERALELLNQYEKTYRESARCPVCFSNNLSLVPRPSVKNWFSAVITWLFGNYAIVAEKVYLCDECGNQFDDLTDLPLVQE